MELSWTTFSLELINFLILIWILKRFLYAPIQKTMLERKKRVQEQLEDAQTRHRQATQLQTTYENRLNDWQQEKATLQNEWHEAMEQWKSDQRLQFEKQLRQEKEQIFSHEMQKASALIEHHAKEAFLLAGKFAGKLLIAFADAHLEEKIIKKTIEDLHHVPVEQWQWLNTVPDEETVAIQTAYPIKEHQKQSLLQVIEHLVPRKLNVSFTENPKLLAGLTLQIGPMCLQANLRDELKFFTETKNELA
ncbi:TPA: F0F1 ATP synthase subunit delta [Legionella pneumophila]|uniref:F0F1 ATP synthase subunit delta n=1 Tax=Legionella pneumophila TaxID=446 RepID=UPI0005CB1F00|nr:F0F1 ATP synthase subunit delta [Legionella pneumophila]HCC3243589.1 F0F1 ATP synthase subunit delta [Legionella pneumophila subsp. pneumophila]MCZ4683301.1 F0F1 ATP synthase subunit delta [Legionella pneumophila]HDV5789940.1 F0F1 ATP synthase subunit delta [Legionella pneumophila]HDV5798923.1 F0F1 ATP synthase subunit delta [Legionella pneumophila]HDV5948488.1 F0F1 ATP synthase subunit delta [Legionella pneumophila]